MTMKDSDPAPSESVAQEPPPPPIDPADLTSVFSFFEALEIDARFRTQYLNDPRATTDLLGVDEDKKQHLQEGDADAIARDLDEEGHPGYAVEVDHYVSAVPPDQRLIPPPTT